MLYLYYIIIDKEGFSFEKILMSRKVAQHWPGLAHVASCDRCKGVLIWTYFTLPPPITRPWRVVVNIIPLYVYVAQELLFIFVQWSIGVRKILATWEFCKKGFFFLLLINYTTAL